MLFFYLFLKTLCNKKNAFVVKESSIQIRVVPDEHKKMLFYFLYRIFFSII